MTRFTNYFSDSTKQEQKRRLGLTVQERAEGVVEKVDGSRIRVGWGRRSGRVGPRGPGGGGVGRRAGEERRILLSVLYKDDGSGDVKCYA